MRTITVHKAELLAHIEKNMKTHRADYEEALEKYRQRAVVELDALIARVRRGDTIRLVVALPVPEEHTADYERAVRMLAMDINDTVQLTEQEYAQYVDDDWGWKYSFGANTLVYKDDPLGQRA